VAVAAMPFQGWDLDRFSSRSARLLEASPVSGVENEMYLTVAARMEKFRVGVPAGEERVLAQVNAGRVTRATVPDGGRRVVQLPVIFYPGLQEVRDNGWRVTTIGQIDGLVALEVG